MKDGSTGLRTAITVGALAVTLIGWAVLAGDREAPPVAPATAGPSAVGATTAAAQADPSRVGALALPSGAAGALPPMPSLVSVDTRPLPPRRAPLPRPDVRTQASRRAR